MEVKTGKCLWCEMPNTEIFGDGLCAMCTETGAVAADRVTPEMADAWINFEPRAGFEIEQGIGYNEIVALMRQAFMTGFARGVELPR